MEHYYDKYTDDEYKAAFERILLKQHPGAEIISWRRFSRRDRVISGMFLANVPGRYATQEIAVFAKFPKPGTKLYAQERGENFYIVRSTEMKKPLRLKKAPNHLDIMPRAPEPRRHDYIWT